MMDRAEAIFILNEEIKALTDGYTTYLAHGGKPDPAEEVYIEAHQLALAALREQEQSKWISVKERLPEANRLVLCWWQSGDGEREHYGFARYQSHGVWYVSNEGMPNVTHWMPLPEPPEGGAEMSKCETCGNKRYAYRCEGCKYDPDALDKYVPMTNADRIRAMTDEELAHELAMVAGWDRKQYAKAKRIGAETVMLDWLQQPAGGADHE